MSGGDGIDFPVVSVWQYVSPSWQRIGDVASYDSLTFTPTFLDVGTWSLTRDYDEQALIILGDRLVTIDWRGIRTTWCITNMSPASDPDTGRPVLTVSGIGAFDFFSRALAWPDATKALTAQPVLQAPDGTPLDALPKYVGAAETVLKLLTTENLKTRYGLDITIPASTGLGSKITVRPQMDRLSDLIVLAKTAGIGVDINLVNTSGTRAELVMQVWQPEDKTKSVLLTQEAGSVDTWEQIDSAPTATRALVAGAGTGGMDRVFTWPVHTAASDAAAAAWGGHREVFVDGPSSFDADELTQAGQQALTDGAATRTLAITAAEAAGTLAFIDYYVGDKATGQVIPDAGVTDVITSITVTVDTDNGISVAPTFGDPNATDSFLDIVAKIRAQAAATRRQERK